MSSINYWNHRWTLTQHAKLRLIERFGMTHLPQGVTPEFYMRISNARKIYSLQIPGKQPLYMVVNKDTHKIISILTKAHLEFDRPTLYGGDK